MRLRACLSASVLLAAVAGLASAQNCSMCAEWNQPQKPFKIYGNTYYVGPHGLAVLLVQSDQGLVLIDGGTRESVRLVTANLRALGFRPGDVKLILNSHVHHDHAGGIAELQRLTGAEVLASEPSAVVMRTGGVARDDPQYGDIRPLDPIAHVRMLAAGEVVHLGSLTLTPHPTPGHTAGGTSWTWTSCEAGKCEQMVYADSVTAVSPPAYKFSEHPELITQFQQDFAWLDAVPCDVLITPHPDASDLFERVARGRAIDTGACKRLAQDGREGLQQRLAKEKQASPHARRSLRSAVR